MTRALWRGRRVLVTGHTGFKGSWLSLWLLSLGASVSGLALRPERPSLYEDAGLDAEIASAIVDVRDAERVARAVRDARPEVVFHLAAQPLVLRSYREPAYTFDVNVTGTANVLDAVRASDGVAACVVVTSDKCYRPAAGPWGLRETDALGGEDPYSASKGAAEIVVGAYRASYFSRGGAAVASARAGNVIGGGDWAADRLVPDAVRALQRGEPLTIRYPTAIRPWQHVLEPLRGYLDLAERLLADRDALASVNFGPGRAGERTVEWLLQRFSRRSGARLRWNVAPAEHAENPVLRLDVSRAEDVLGWTPRLPIEATVDMTYDWYFGEGGARERTLSDIARYEERG